MPYDKGDFTQQGVDGKVAGGLLLNNKRDVDVLVTTNEDDSTLGRIAVTVEDHLNDLKYAFFGENLEAGEVYEIGAGGGDLTTATMSVSNTSSHEAIIGAPIVDTENNYLIVNAPVAKNTDATFTVVLYKNQLIFDLYSIDDNQDITVSGNATYEDDVCVATGDFSITYDNK